MTHLTYLEAAVVGLVQGVSEMFPVSSLGHNVLIPAIIGGSWASDLNVSKAESPYLAFIVGLHVATAIALLIYFRRDWIRIIGGFFTSIRDRGVRTEDQKLAWMIIVATIPVGIVGLLFEHAFRVIFGKPIIAGIFLAVNGVILIAGERYRSRASKAADAAIAGERDPRLIPAREPELVAAGRSPAGSHARAGARDLRQQEQAEAVQADRRLARMGYPAGDRWSAPRRSWPCWPASAGTGSPWSPAWPAGCPGRTRPGSPSSWPRRSSWPPAR